MALLFLSCLCGSEHDNGGQGGNDGFLSCLCGSERQTRVADGRLNFLSCLCGSERTRNFRILHG